MTNVNQKARFTLSFFIKGAAIWKHNRNNNLDTLELFDLHTPMQKYFCPVGFHYGWKIATLTYAAEAN